MDQYRKPEFMFFSRSAHVYPGTGADEYIHTDDIIKYDRLHRIRDWRKMMSNFYARKDMTPLFTLDEMNWRTVEHYFHAQKFKESNPDYYRSFALDSGSILSASDGATVKRAGRAVKMTPNQIKYWENGGSKIALDKSIRAKYTQNDDLKQILLLTGDAILKHRMSRFSPVIIEHRLMNLRDEIRTESRNEVNN